MKLLPYDKFDLFVNEPLSLAKYRLMDYVGQGVSSSVRERPFVGEVEDKSFKIRRKIDYRNSFLPILHGKFEDHSSYTHITVRMSMHPFVTGFIAVWTSVWGVMTIEFIRSTKDITWEAIGHLVVMIVGALLMTYLSFWFEARKAKAMFFEIFNKVAAKQKDTTGRNTTM